MLMARPVKIPLRRIPAACPASRTRQLPPFNVSILSPQPPPVTARPVPVTVVIPTLNEADRLPACLSSVLWADEVIVADAGSTDHTVEIARRFGARVLESCGPTIGAQKNAGIEVARHAWILSIDADERVTPELQSAITQALAAPAAVAYRVHLRNRYLGAAFDRGGWARDYHVRLFPSTYRWTTHKVHERLNVEGHIATLAGRLEHESYRDLAHQLEKAVRYSAWGADDLRHRGKRVRASQLLLNPLWRFVKTYLFEGMWREGWRGFVFCMVHAWCAFSKYALLWDAERKAGAVPHAQASASFQAADAAVRLDLAEDAPFVQRA